MNNLTDNESDGYNVKLNNNSQSVYWLPAMVMFNIPHYADSTEINFTAKNGDKQICAGCIYITSEKFENKPPRIYKASIVGSGLRIKQDEEYAGAIVYLDDSYISGDTDYAQVKSVMSSDNLTIMDEIELTLMKICSSPAHSSNPGAYIEEDPREYEKLIEYDEFTLRYCFDEFLKGNQNDLRGHIMAIACREILKNYGEFLVSDEGFMTGQDWFDAYYAAAYETYEKMLLIDFLKYYKGAYILIMIDGAE